MFTQFLANFIGIFFQVLMLAIVGRALYTGAFTLREVRTAVTRN